ncbi:MAG TPA: RimK-like ATPgrasp N-terminal domain-containing protein [Trueperaceae bacterium]|nr:RimK-like ATPgrasp N-terminal domain-containing protein [Trueperaceae bacterium]
MDGEPSLLRLTLPTRAAELANMAGDYSYLTSGYYHSLDAELAGLKVIPTSGDALDAYVVPIAMEKARLADLPLPTFHLATTRFPAPPFMAYPVNPFSSKGELVADAEQLAARRNGLTYTGKYAVLCQELPEDYRIDVVRCVLGRSLVPEYAAFTEAVFAVFRLPLARVRVIVTAKAFLLSAFLPLPLDQLTPEELALVEESGTWQG